VRLTALAYERSTHDPRIESGEVQALVGSEDRANQLAESGGACTTECEAYYNTGACHGSAGSSRRKYGLLKVRKLTLF